MEGTPNNYFVMEEQMVSRRNGAGWGTWVNSQVVGLLATVLNSAWLAGAQAAHGSPSSSPLTLTTSLLCPLCQHCGGWCLKTGWCQVAKASCLLANLVPLPRGYFLVGIRLWYRELHAPLHAHVHPHVSNQSSNLSLPNIRTFPL